jgi:hypothetical protein
MDTTYAIRAVLIQEGDGRWSAQCLEYDIAAHAKTLAEVRYELGKAIVGHIVVSQELGTKPFESIGSAPQRYWEMFEGAKEKLVADNMFFRVVGQGVPVVESDLRVAELQAA